MNLDELEAELLLIGGWKNIQEIEENLNLPEIQAIVSASREREHRHNKFLAALKGIDLDEGTKQSAEEKFEEVQRRAMVKLYGERHVDDNEILSLGFEVEIEE